MQVRLGKALFLCDRTEFRDNGLTDFQAAFGTNAAEVDTRNPQKNARVLIATYQTLDFSEDGKDATFFLKHYPPGFFDVIVIDECHRSAWGEWHRILESNKSADSNRPDGNASTHSRETSRRRGNEERNRRRQT